MRQVPVRPAVFSSLRRSFVTAVALFAAGLLCGFLVSQSGRFFRLLFAPAKSGPNPIVFRMQFRGTSSLCEPNTPMDACVIMPQCFGESESHRTLESCQSSMRDVFRYYHNGHLIEVGSDGKERLVGFISLYPYRRGDITMLMIYNVCIHKDDRSRGLGKRLLSEAIEAMITEFKLDRDRLLLALDVDLRSPTAGDAFAVYARLGFARWIAPCEGIHNYDFSQGLQDSKQLPPLTNNFVGLLRDPQEYIRQVYEPMDTSKRYPTHFCMYKWYNDSLVELGKMLARQIAKMDEASKKQRSSQDDSTEDSGDGNQ